MIPSDSPPLKLQQQRLGFIVSDVARLIRRNFNRRVQHLGLTQTQWQILAHVAHNEGMRQIQLADALEMQPISVARTIDRMQAAGWLERRADPSDRRAFNLYLAPKANPIIEQMWQLGAETRAQALAGIPVEQTELLMQTLLQMRENLILDSEPDA